MRRLLALIAAAALLSTIAAAASAGSPDVDKGPRFTDIEKRYLRLYPDARKAFGYETVGRNIVRTGMTNTKVATQEQISESADRMDRWLNPPAPEPVSSSSASAAPSYSGGSANATVMCESGGDYSINTGNGYYGGYQFDSQTWDAYGDPAYAEAHLAPPAVQDQAAARVPYDAWPNC